MADHIVLELGRGLEMRGPAFGHCADGNSTAASIAMPAKDHADEKEIAQHHIAVALLLINSRRASGR